MTASMKQRSANATLRPSRRPTRRPGRPLGRRPGRPTLAGLLLGLVLSTTAASAVEEPAPVFVEHIDVRAVDVEVVVKKAGEVVRGLRPADFKVSLDGQVLPIDDFVEVRDGVSPIGAMTTRYLVFIDDDFSVPAQRNAVLRRFANQLEQLAAQDRMAVVAWDGRQVELLSSWQPRGESLRQVFEEAQERPAYGLKRHSEWRRLQSALSYRDRLPGAGGSSFSSIGFSGSTRPGPLGPRSAAQLRARVSHLASALASAMRGFAQPPGRRAVIFLSGALPPVNDSVFTERDRTSPGRFARSTGARRLFTPAVSAANRLGYTIYPVDLGSPDGLDSFAVGADVSGIYEAERRRELAREEDALGDDALLYLADATGGRAWLDGGRFQALESIVEDTRSYYRLGLTPQWRGDDEELPLQVEWLGDGRVEIRARRGFLDLSPAARVTMAVESAHLFDLPLPDERQIAVEVGAVEKKSRSRMVVPLTLRFPVDGVTFLGEHQGGQARLELRIAASDDRGDSAEIPVVSITIRQQEVESGFVTWETALELRRRSHRLLLAIHDPLGQRVLAQRLTIDPVL